MRPRQPARAALFAASLLAVVPAAAAPILELVSTIALPGVKGRIDHLAADPKDHHIFIAALGNDTVEVVDAEGKQHETVPGFVEPQGIAYVPESKRIFVANGEGNRVDIVDVSSLKVLERIRDVDDADNVRYDATSGTVYDADSGKVVARVPIGKDTDDMYFDAERKRVYVICGEGRVDVIRQETPDNYAAEASIETAAKARTGIFVPEEQKVFVAAPASGANPARILTYRMPNATGTTR